MTTARRIPIVFVPGIKGSRLIDAKGAIRWLGAKQAIGFDRRPLSLPLDSHQQERTVLYPDGVLERVLWEPVYQPFIQWMTEQQRELEIFSYDWRRDCLDLSNQLQIFLQQIVAKRGPAIVLAHSLGGLLAFKVLRNAPGLFHSVLFAGVPFGAGVDFVRNMHNGEKVGLNSTITSAAVHFSWSSPYVFFPTPAQNNKVVDPRGNPVMHNWYSAASWEQLKLSIFNNARFDLMPSRKHLTQALSTALEFREYLAVTPELQAQKPRIAVLASQAHPTLAELVYDELAIEDRWNFDQGKKVPGDGRVEFASCLAPKPLEQKIFLTAKTHAALFNDVTTLSEALNWLS